METVPPWFWLIAGPNGVGKTTYARAHLKAVAGTVRFVNADELARGVSPIEPEAGKVRAARLVLQFTAEHIAAGETFALETTLSGHAQLEAMARARAAGFRVGLLYFTVPDVETCLERIARRVAMGGHPVPEADVRRRFPRSAANFQHYAASADLWRLFDNRGAPAMVAEGSGPAIRWRAEAGHGHFAALLDAFAPPPPAPPPGD